LQLFYESPGEGLRASRHGDDSGDEGRKGARDGESSALKPPSDSASAGGRRPLHDHESGALQMLDEALGDNLRHELVGVVDALPP
jgi:hypothetical protein